MGEPRTEPSFYRRQQADGFRGYLLFWLSTTRNLQLTLRRLTALSFLYEANEFSFDKLVPWLRRHVALGNPRRRNSVRSRP